MSVRAYPNFQLWDAAQNTLPLFVASPARLFGPGFENVQPAEATRGIEALKWQGRDSNERGSDAKQSAIRSQIDFCEGHVCS